MHAFFLQFWLDSDVAALFEGRGELKYEALLFQSTVDINFQNAHKTLFQFTVNIHFQNAHKTQKLQRLALCAFI